MGKIWPLYIRIPLAPVRILGMLITVVPMIVMMLCGFEDEGIEAMSFIMKYGNEEDWRE